MKVFAPAKVNLMLHITGRRPDGFHVMQSVVAFADYGDVLEITPSDVFDFAVTGPFAAHAPVGEDNLVVRAVRMMEDRAVRKAHVAITLAKNLPAGAGLGGGSADAAALLQGLNDVWGQPFSHVDLQHMALKLGADVPVCLERNAQWVEGIGEKVTPVSLSRSMAAVLVWPGQALATPAMFKAYYAAQAPFTPVMPKPAAINVEWLSTQNNDFTNVAAASLPALKQILQHLDGLDGCRLAQLSGSGSACFGLFDKNANAKKAAEALSAAFPDMWVTPCVINL